MLRFSLPERTQYIDELLSKFPDTPTLTLAKKAYKEYPLWWNNLDSCRSMIRNFRGNMGNMTRSYTNKKHFRPNGKAGELRPCPPASTEDWQPYLITGTKRLLVLSDVHVPYQHVKGINTFIKYAKDHIGPDAILLNGDIADFYSVSHWERNPHKRDLVEEVEQVGIWLDWLRECFPKVPIVYKEGNHEERLDKYIWQKAPELWGLQQVRLAEILKLKERRIAHVGDQRMIYVGHAEKDGDKGLLILHGHEMPRGMTNPVNMARGAYLRTNVTMLCGHGHRTSHHPEPNARHKITSCWSTGCLCDMNPRYMRINKWNLGAAYVEVNAPGSWRVHNYIIDKHALQVF